MPAAVPTTYDHVVWIVMENHSYAEIVGSSSAPYINEIAGKYGLATNYFAISHPSLPNYIALTSGSTQGIADDDPPLSHPLNVSSIFSQLDPGNWRSLEESMPSNCAKTDSGAYAVRHNPAAYYTNLSDCSTLNVPLGAAPDLSAKFTFVTPNVINDMHDGTIEQGDNWLSMFVPQVLSSAEYQGGNTAVYITWDEDDGSSGNHVATIVIAPSVKPGTRSSTEFSHYSMLRTTEEQLGLGLIGEAATTTSMRSAFGF
jgi:phosphatidylinositol-3-phosphatase